MFKNLNAIICIVIICITLSWYQDSKGEIVVIPEENNAYTNLPNCDIISVAQNSNITEIEEKLKNGANVNCQNKFGKTALMIAAAHNPDAIPVFIDYGANVNLKDNHGYTALMMAIRHSNTASVKYLTKADIDLEAKDPDLGWTALMMACNSINDDLEIIELLLESGADVNNKDNNGQTALMRNIRGKVNAIKLLLSYGADINDSDNYKSTALMQVAEYGSVKTIENILSYKPNINQLDKWGQNALIYAASNKNPEAIEVLVKAGIDVGILKTNGHKALLNAVLAKNLSSVKKLIELGMDINSTDEDGKIFFSQMVSKGYPTYTYKSITKELIKLGMDINKPDKTGKTPLMHAVISENYEAFELFLNTGADSLIVDSDGRDFADHFDEIYKIEVFDKIIEIALKNNILTNQRIDELYAKRQEQQQYTAEVEQTNERNGSITYFDIPDENNMEEYIRIAKEENAITEEQIAELRQILNEMKKEIADHNIAEMQFESQSYIEQVLAQTPDINAKNENGETLLMTTCQWECNIEHVKAIVNSGADIDIKNNEGQTALMIAARHCSPETVQFLIDSGADLYKVRNDQKNILMHAAQNSDPNVIKIFINNFDVNAKTDQNWTALMFAARDGSPEVVEELIKAGADVHARTLKGKDVFLNAVQNDSIEIMQMLIDAGVDATFKRRTPYYNYPLCHAVLWANDPNTVLFLVEQIHNSEEADKQIKAALATAIGNYENFHIGQNIFETLKSLASQSEGIGTKELTQILIDQISYIETVEKIHELINIGADPNGINAKGTTVLMAAANNVRPEVVQAILEYNIDVNRVSEKTGKTALHCAIASNPNLEIAKILIKAGADINNKQIYGGLPKMAALNHNSEAILFLREYSFIDSEQNCQVFIEATCKGKLQLFKQLLENGIEKDCLTQALYKLSKSGFNFASNNDPKLEMVKELISNGANVHYKDEKTSCTILMGFCGNSGVSSEIVQLLIDEGVDVNTKSRGKGTALMSAASDGNIEAIKILIDAGANLEDKSSLGRTALLIAINHNKPKAAKLLISSGAKIDKSNSFELFSTALGTYGSKNELFDLVISAGADINGTDRDGKTILMQLCRNSHDISLIQLVIDSGADVSLKDNKGRDAAYYLGKNSKLSNSNILKLY